MELTGLGLAAAAAAIREGRVTSVELVEACLDRIAAREEQVQAWAFLDADHARGQAAVADRMRKEGAPLGPLHGVPVGVKDIIDTADMPTEDGTPLHAGRQPHRDARVVALLRQAGAIVLGKTVTTELAVYSPGKTRNPHDPKRTPGGSSSGSAAAVAANMVPFALGSQTNGSVIRPASYCGVVGFKPSHGLISRAGMLKQSRLLDQAGVFARSIEDVALGAELLFGYDPADEDTVLRARAPLVRVAAEEPPVPPRLAFVETPVWDQAEEGAKAAFGELQAVLGERIAPVGLPGVFGDAIECHRTILEADLAVSFAQEYEHGRDRLSKRLVEMIESGHRRTAPDYIRAVARQPILRGALDGVLEEFDAIVTPATTGEAPLGLDSTGSPIFCTIWTYLGVPAITLPLLAGPAGMPVGVQLVAAKGDDARLLRTARWLARFVAGEGKPRRARSARRR
jgi:Asp-tRNA(Asn)/Glu-tRNA(Gln) amidotransferase A subunit family amidase